MTTDLTLAMSQIKTRDYFPEHVLKVIVPPVLRMSACCNGDQGHWQADSIFGPGLAGFRNM
jgi:hypothetical protein